MNGNLPALRGLYFQGVRPWCTWLDRCRQTARKPWTRFTEPRKP